MKDLLHEESYHVSYHDIRKRQNGNTIDHFEYLNKTFIVHATGPILERFTVSQIERTIDSSNPHLCLKRISSYMVDGSILQVSSFKNKYTDKELPLIAIRTTNSHILMFNFKRLEQYWGIIKIEHLKFSSELYDFVWNRGDDADLISITEDGGIYLWQGWIDSNKLRILRKPVDQEDEVREENDSKPLLRKKIYRDPHLRCTFGMNANCLYISTPNKLILIDYQNSHAVESVLLLVTNEKTKIKEENEGDDCEAFLYVEVHETIQAVTSHPTNPFIFVIATEKYLYLYDRRFLKRPLIKWKHHLDTGNKRIPILNRVKITPDWNTKSGISFVYVWDSTSVEIFQYFHENTFNNKKSKESIHELLTKITEDRTIGTFCTIEGTVDNKRDIYKTGTSYARLIGLPRKIIPLKIHSLLNSSDEEGFNSSLSGITIITSESENFVLKSNNSSEINVDLYVVYSTLNGDIYSQAFIFNRENINRWSKSDIDIKIKKEKKTFVQPSDNILKEHEIINVHGLFKYMIGKRNSSKKNNKRQKIAEDDDDFELSIASTLDLNDVDSSPPSRGKKKSDHDYLKKFESQILSYIDDSPRTLREIHSFLLMNCSIPYTAVSIQSLKEFLNEKCGDHVIFEDEKVHKISLRSRDTFDIPEEEKTIYYGQSFKNSLDFKVTIPSKTKRKDNNNKKKKITTPKELFSHLEKQWDEEIQKYKPVSRPERRHSQLPSNRLSQIMSSNIYSQSSPSLASQFSQGTPSTPTVTKSIPIVSSRHSSQTFASLSQGGMNTPIVSSSLPTVTKRKK